LVGLSKLSHYYEGDIKSFDVKRGKSKLSTIVDNIDFENFVPKYERITEGEGEEYEEFEYDAGQDYDEYYKEPDIEAYYVTNDKITSLSEAINELIGLNTKQIKKLKTVENYKNENQEWVLDQQLFKSFQVSRLIKIHTDLDREFEILKLSYKEIGNIFQRFQDRFLVYCEISAALKPITYFFKEQMTYNDALSKHVLEMEEKARNDKMDGDTGVTKITDLATEIPVIVINLKRIIDEIIKYSKREGKDLVQKEAKKARDILENLNQHQDLYGKHSQNIELMEEIMKEIDPGRGVRKLHEFGTFRKHVENIELQMFTAKKNTWTTVELMLFNHYLVVIKTDVLDAEELLNMDDDIGAQCMELFRDRPLPCKKQYFTYFNMRRINFLPTGEDKKYKFLELRTFSKEGIGKVVDEESARIRIKKTDQPRFDFLQDQIDQMIKTATAKIPQVGKHSNCRGYKTKKEIKNIKDHRKCGECNGFLLGKIPLGIECSPCGKVFHMECYLSYNKITESDEFPVISKEPNNVVELKKLSEIDNAFQTKEDAEEELSKKDHGTFLLRFNEEKNQSVVSVIDKESDPKKSKVKHHIIKSQAVKDREYYWINQGEAATSLTELIKTHQKSLNLLIPIRSKTLNLDPNGAEGYSSDEEEDVYENRDDYVRDTSIYIGAALRQSTQSSVTESFHGDISREDAEFKLEGQDTGTFLIRQNLGQYKITRVPSRGNKANFMIQQNEQGYYYVEKNGKTFQSLTSLVKHLQNLDESNKYWIGKPLSKSA